VSKTNLKETKMATSPQLRAAQADFASTFDAFKSANDARLSEIEQKASADIVLSEKVERINAALDQQSKRLERLSISAAQPGLSSDNGPSEAKSAWGAYIRTGDGAALATLEGKSLSSSVDSEGGYWAGETDARPETSSPALELLEFPAGELYAMPAATQMLLDDGVADVDQWLADEVRDVFAAQETAAFVSGNGVNKPKGLLDYAAVPEGSQTFGQLGYVATGTDGAFDADAPIDAIMDLIYAPKPRFRAGASFVMNRRTISALRKFKDADGNYIWQPATEAGQPSTLLGYPLTEVEDMPDIGSGSFSVAFGDFRRGYLVVDRQGVRVLRDPYSAKPYVLFYTTKRVGGGVQDFGAIKLLKFAAG